MPRFSRYLAIAAAGGAGCWAGAAGAADPVAMANSPMVQAIAACQAIGEDSKRLACFDRETRALTEGVRAGAVSVVGTSEIRKAKRELFGFSLPKLKMFEQDGEEVDQIATTAKSVRKVAYGRFQVVTAEGAVWETLDEPRFDPKAGDKLVLKKGTLGNVFMRVDGAAGIRARRVQ